MLARKKSGKQKQAISMQGVITWINSLLGLQLICIEQLGSGAIYCQIFEAVHPGSIPMHKVNWQAKHEHEFTSNLRLLQNAFWKVGVKRPLQPLKLAKAKCPDNFELAVWLRNHYYENVEETDCTFSSSVSEKADFSFAHRKVIPKRFSLSRRLEGDKDEYWDQSQEREKLLVERKAALSVKLQMIEQLVNSHLEAEEKLRIIGEIMNLDYGRGEG